MRPAMTPKVAVPESTRWTEWIPSILRPPAWTMEVLRGGLSARRTKSSRPEGPKAIPKGRQLEVRARTSSMIYFKYILGIWLWLNGRRSCHTHCWLNGKRTCQWHDVTHTSNSARRTFRCIFYLFIFSLASQSGVFRGPTHPYHLLLLSISDAVICYIKH